MNASIPNRTLKPLKIGPVDVDSHNFPNLPLMKMSARSAFFASRKTALRAAVHFTRCLFKAQGHEVSLITPLEALSGEFDFGYASKVFSFTAMPALPPNFEIGGTGSGGADAKKVLPEEIEHICPDYSLYGLNYSLGFLTRGCIRNCTWCAVPAKEGYIKAHADIEEFARHRDVILMDNNILACEHGIRQIEKIAQMGLRVDFNQGLDARLIDDATARLLAKVNWLKPIRLACDSQEMMKPVEKAVNLLRKHGAKPREYSVYVLVKDVEDALERVNFLRRLKVKPFCQPFRDPKTNAEPTKQQRDFARWVNCKQIFYSVDWSDYQSNYKPNNKKNE